MAKPVLLLDLGGVLADLGDPVRAMNLNMESAAFWDIWLGSKTVKAFETGRISEAEFLAAMGPELGAQEGFAQRFFDWRLELFPGIDAFIRTQSERYRLALLSNTNPTHWRQVTASSDVFSAFERLFLSFETGHFKPSPESFRQVVSDLTCDPGEITFLDDSARNVDAATRSGLRAFVVNGPEEARERLQR